METGSKTVCSSDTIHLRENRRVHWALNLEEVLYFTPETESKNVQSLMKKLKIKTRILKNISPAFCDRDIVRKLHGRITRIVERISTGHCDYEMNAEDATTFDKYWNDLFEFYGPCKTDFEKAISGNIFMLSIQE